jgi:hypothetical protein
MAANRYLKLWMPIIGLHALHQLEESIGFFQWYIDYADKIPKWLLIINLNIAKKIILHPEYFIVASIGQLFFVTLVAFIFRRKENMTKVLIFIYLFGLAFFLIWHILSGYFAHSYAPIMVTCLLGLYLIPNWTYKMFLLNKPN